MLIFFKLIIFRWLSILRPIQIRKERILTIDNGFYLKIALSPGSISEIVSSRVIFFPYPNVYDS